MAIPQTDELKSEHFFPYSSWTQRLPSLAHTYQENAPFPHVQLEEFLPTEIAKKISKEFPGPESIEWIQYRHLNSKKNGTTDMSRFPADIRSVVQELLSDRFVTWLSELTGIPGLIADPTLEGGGLHQSVTGGFLNIHADFNRHYRFPDLTRRVNLLVYLNENWQDQWNGQLELWDRSMTTCVKKISPILNRAVIFSTDADSFHGHPEPLKTPIGVTRKSIALYYFTKDKVTGIKVRGTNYKTRPQDNLLKRIFLTLDKLALNLYSYLRRTLNFKDGAIKGLLGRQRKS